jgi:hypothetical protein
LAEIKSALELALEKAERYGKASKEEMAAAQSQEQGRQLAVKFLKGEGDLAAELQNLAPETREAARTAVKEVFLRNIALPRNNEEDDRQDRALEGLVLVAAHPKEMARFRNEVRQLLQQFLQYRQNALQQLKARFSQGLGQMQRAVEAKFGQGVRLEVEHLPQFQEEWRRFFGQLLEQFEPLLEDLKERMRSA